MQIVVEPIGYVRSSRAAAEDDDWDRETTFIELLPEFGPQSVAGLLDFSHLEVLYHFHRLDPSRVEKSAWHPRGNAAWPLTGVFAQRSRYRPNRLGATICHLLGIEDGRLQVSGLDAIDGTPVLDLKPVMREFLPRGPMRQPAWSHELMQAYWDGQSGVSRP